jgi:hypothetical protein
MAVNVEMWKPQIIEKLFADNAFMMRAVNADEYVVGGSIVHIPQAGDPTTTLINNTTFPVIVVSRQDTDILYALDEFIKPPNRISDIDKKELSYDKRASVIKMEMNSLIEDAGNWMLYRWLNNVPNAATHRVPTTGTVGSGGLKVLTEADVLAAQLLFNKQNIPAKGRVLLLDTDHEGQLRSDDKLKYAFQQVVSLPDGVIGRLHGFDIYTRSSVLKINAGGAVKAPNALAAGTDKAVSAFYHEDCVERALGQVDVFDNERRAEYYGDVISFLLRNGGRHNRQDLKGFGLIVPA